MQVDDRHETRLAGHSLADGRYELLELAGAGAFGVVYRARHTALDRDVAVKILFRDVAARHAGVAARFKREAQAVSALQHPNIVQVVDFGDDDGLLYLVMEYLNGQSLYEFLASGEQLSLQEVVSIVAQVCGALAAAHDKGTVHRDIKPENVIVLERRFDDGSQGIFVKVVDFGIAKVRSGGSDGDGMSLTGEGEVFGTPEYMSPEQARGVKLDARSDIYSTGVMLYQLVCGRTPFQDAETAVGMLLRHVTDPVPPPSQFAPNIPDVLEDLILKTLEKDPSRRPQTARELRAAVLELAPGGMTEQFGSGAVRIPLSGSLGSAQTVGLEEQDSAAMRALVDDNLPDARSSSSAEGRGRWGIVVAAVLLVVAAVVAVVVLRPPADVPGNSAPPAPAPPAEVAEAAGDEAVVATPAPSPAPPPPEPEPGVEVEQEVLLAAAVDSGARGSLSALSGHAQPVAEPALPEAEPATSASRRRARRSRSARDERRSSDAAAEQAAKPTAKPIEPEPEEPPSPAPEVVAAVASSSDPTPPRPKEPEPPAAKAPAPAPSLAARASLGSVAVKGPVSKGVVTNAIKGKLGELETCYSTAAHSAGRDEKMTLKVGFEIDVDGWASNVDTSRSALPGLDRCAKNVFAGIRLRDRPDTGTVLAGVRVVFTPR